MEPPLLDTDFLELQSAGPAVQKMLEVMSPRHLPDAPGESSSPRLALVPQVRGLASPASGRSSVARSSSARSLRTPVPGRLQLRRPPPVGHSLALLPSPRFQSPHSAASPVSGPRQREPELLDSDPLALEIARCGSGTAALPAMLSPAPPESRSLRSPASLGRFTGERGPRPLSLHRPRGDLLEDPASPAAPRGARIKDLVRRIRRDSNFGLDGNSPPSPDGWPAPPGTASPRPPGLRTPVPAANPLQRPARALSPRAPSNPLQGRPRGASWEAQGRLWQPGLPMSLTPGMPPVGGTSEGALTDSLSEALTSLDTSPRTSPWARPGTRARARRPSPPPV